MSAAQPLSREVVGYLGERASVSGVGYSHRTLKATKAELIDIGYMADEIRPVAALAGAQQAGEAGKVLVPIDTLREINADAWSDDKTRMRAIARTTDHLLASSPSAEAWQPIETAPKDGTRILVSFGTLGVWQVHWDDEDFGSGWLVDDNKHGPYPLRGWSYDHPTAPTHWMPTPALSAKGPGHE